MANVCTRNLWSGVVIENNKFLKDGTELLLGYDFKGKISVSQWTKNLELIFSSKFKSYEEAKKFFEEWK